MYLKDTLTILYEQITNIKFPDIFEFQNLINNDEFVHPMSLSLYICKHNNNMKLILDKIQINKNNKSLDENKEVLYNKFIRTEKLKPIIENIFKFSQRKNTSIYSHYDDLILYSLNKIQPKYIFTETYGTIQYINRIHELNITQKMNDDKQKIEDSLFYISYMFSHSENNEEEKLYVLHEYYNILSNIFNKFNDVPMKAFTLHRKFIKCKEISKVEKNNLEFYVNSLLN